VSLVISDPYSEAMWSNLTIFEGCCRGEQTLVSGLLVGSQRPEDPQICVENLHASDPYTCLDVSSRASSTARSRSSASTFLLSAVSSASISLSDS